MTAVTHRRRISVILLPFLVDIGEKRCAVGLVLVYSRRTTSQMLNSFRLGLVFFLLKSLDNFKVSQNSKWVLLNLSDLFLSFHFHHQHHGWKKKNTSPQFLWPIARFLLWHKKASYHTWSETLYLQEEHKKCLVFPRITWIYSQVNHLVHKAKENRTLLIPV